MWSSPSKTSEQSWEHTPYTPIVAALLQHALVASPDGSARQIHFSNQKQQIEHLRRPSSSVTNEMRCDDEFMEFEGRQNRNGQRGTPQSLQSSKLEDRYFFEDVRRSDPHLSVSCVTVPLSSTDGHEHELHQDSSRDISTSSEVHRTDAHHRVARQFFIHDDHDDDVSVSDGAGEEVSLAVSPDKSFEEEALHRRLASLRAEVDHMHFALEKDVFTQFHVSRQKPPQAPIPVNTTAAEVPHNRESTHTSNDDGDDEGTTSLPPRQLSETHSPSTSQTTRTSISLSIMEDEGKVFFDAFAKSRHCPQQQIAQQLRAMLHHAPQSGAGVPSSSKHTALESHAQGRSQPKHQRPQLTQAKILSRHQAAITTPTASNVGVTTVVVPPPPAATTPPPPKTQTSHVYPTTKRDITHVVHKPNPPVVDTRQWTSVSKLEKRILSPASKKTLTSTTTTKKRAVLEVGDRQHRQQPVSSASVHGSAAPLPSAVTTDPTTSRVGGSFVLNPTRVSTGVDTVPFTPEIHSPKAAFPSTNASSGAQCGSNITSEVTHNSSSSSSISFHSERSAPLSAMEGPSPLSAKESARVATATGCDVSVDDADDIDLFSCGEEEDEE